ncbi:MAG: hypothetical protein ACYDAE_08785 [Steroidobacteraceae bacterium]
MPPEQAAACGNQAAAELRNIDSCGEASQGGSGGMHRMRAPFEQTTGVGNRAAGPAQALGMVAHGSS